MTKPRDILKSGKRIGWRTLLQAIEAGDTAPIGGPGVMVRASANGAVVGKRREIFARRQSMREFDALTIGDAVPRIGHPNQWVYAWRRSVTTTGGPHSYEVIEMAPPTDPRIIWSSTSTAAEMARNRAENDNTATVAAHGVSLDGGGLVEIFVNPIPPNTPVTIREHRVYTIAGVLERHYSFSEVNSLKVNCL